MLAFAIYEVRRFLTTGIAELHGWPIAKRERKPGYFWFYVVIVTMIGIACLAFLLYPLLLLLGWP